MEINEAVDSDDSNVNDLQKNKDAIAEAKRKLKKEIEELKSIIFQVECSLDITKFGSVKSICDTTDVPPVNQVPDANVKLQNELYRYAGIYCVKFSKNEYIFNLTPTNKYEKENAFAVQILNKNNQGSLGKWVMPMSVDMDDLVSQFPIDKLKNIPHFLRTSKHCVDCYFVRREQFQRLMDTVSHMKHCTLQSNLGYTRITLELSGVHNTENDVYMDLIIYLMYNIEEARPYKIEVDSKTKKPLKDEIIKQIKFSLKCFKFMTLNSAFEQVLSEKDLFVWTREDDEDSPIELNNLSSSDEEDFLEGFKLQPGSSSIAQKRKRKIRKRKKHLISPNKTKISVTSEREKRQSKSLNETPPTKGNTSRIAMTPNKTERKHTKLKQTKLRFQDEQNQEPSENSDSVSSEMISSDKKINKNMTKLLTSTPLHLNVQNPSKFIASNSSDISEISLIKDVQRKSKEKGQSQASAPMRMLRNKTKANIQTLIHRQNQNLKKNKK